MPRAITLRLNGEPFLERAELASSLPDRMRGLLGRTSLPPRHGLLLVPCPSIHMIGMKFPIDAVFLDRTGRVIRIVRDIRPWTFIVSGGPSARSTLELAAGWLPPDALRIGDLITWT